MRNYTVQRQEAMQSPEYEEPSSGGRNFSNSGDSVRRAQSHVVGGMRGAPMASHSIKQVKTPETASLPRTRRSRFTRSESNESSGSRSHERQEQPAIAPVPRLGTIAELDDEMPQSLSH